MITAMELREENCQRAASDPMLLATDLADHLVKAGIPFRHAHELVGKAVAEAIRSSIPLDQLNFTALDPAFPADAAAVFSLDRALAARSNPGAPAIANVLAEIQRWHARLQ
jgi:argininosuccinate lyase